MHLRPAGAPARPAREAAHPGQPDRAAARAACEWSRDRYVSRAKRVIVAVPPVLAGRIDYSPGLPAAARPAHAARCRRAPCSRSRPSTTGRSGATKGLNGTARLAERPGERDLRRLARPTARPACCSASSAATRAARFRGLSTADRRAAVLKNFADYFGAEALRPSDLLRDRLAGRQVVARRPGRHRRTRRAAGPRPGDPPAGRAASTGPAPRPRPTGTATWTAPCARASGPRARCSTGCEAAALIALALLASLLAAAPTAGAQRARFDTRVLAQVPRPGFPAMAYVHPTGASTWAPT